MLVAAVGMAKVYLGGHVVRDALMGDTKLPEHLNGAVAGSGPISSTNEMLCFNARVSDDFLVGYDGRKLVWRQILLQRALERAEVEADGRTQNLLEADPILVIIAISPFVSGILNL